VEYSAKQLRLSLALSILAFGLAWSPPAQAIRVKDLATVEGVRVNQLVGYGLVVGLNGTGDKSSTRFTNQTVINMLERLGVHIDPGAIGIKNVAAVVVTANLEAFARIGSKLDVLVNSIGDATSLTGGTLLMTPLKGADGEVYAVAQGPLLVGGFQVTGATGSTASKNHPTVGRIPQGATVEKELEYTINDMGQLKLTLDKQDFSTAAKIVKAINDKLKGQYALAMDAATIQLQVPPQYQGDVVGLMAAVEDAQVAPDTVARVVIDERNGTIVMGQDVRISTVAVAHGALSIQVRETPEVSQPLPFSQGQTTVVPDRKSVV
jgi:flagellar P-ring protein precursor FlgI